MYKCLIFSFFFFVNVKEKAAAADVLEYCAELFKQKKKQKTN